MKQISESIIRIQKEKKNNNYIISFDSSEIFNKVKINGNEYLELMSFRDNSICGNVLEAFILNNNISNPKIIYNRNIDKHKENIQKEKMTIGNFVLPTYNFCHQSSRRK